MNNDNPMNSNNNPMNSNNNPMNSNNNPMNSNNNPMNSNNISKKVAERTNAQKELPWLEAATSMKFLLGLSPEELAKQAWGSHAYEYLTHKGLVVDPPRFKTQQVEGYGFGKTSFEAVVKYTMALLHARSGFNTPKNIDGEELAPGSEINMFPSHPSSLPAPIGEELNAHLRTLAANLSCKLRAVSKRRGVSVTLKNVNKQKASLMSTAAVINADKSKICFLADYEHYQEVIDYFGGSEQVPRNIYFHDFFGPVVCHRISYREMLWYAKALGSFKDSNGKYPITIEESNNSFRISFDENDMFFDVEADGDEIVAIRDPRGRFINNSVLWNNLIGDAVDLPCANTNLRILPASAVFINYLLSSVPAMPKQGIYRAAYVARSMVAERMPFSGTDESGASTFGRRMLYERYNFADLSGGFALPYTQKGIRKDIGDAESYRKSVPVKAETSPLQDKVLYENGLVRLHKGSMKPFGSWLISWDMKELSTDERIKVFNQYNEVVSKYSSIEELANDLNCSSIEECTEEGVFIHYNKKDKMTKRAALLFPLSGKSIEGVHESFSLVMMDNKYHEDQGIKYKVVSGNFIGPPGQCHLLSNQPPMRPIETTPKEFPRYSFDDNGLPDLSYVLEGGTLRTIGYNHWRIEYQDTTFLSKGETVLKLHYPIKNGGYGYDSIETESDMYIEYLDLRIRKAGKNDGPLECKVHGYTIETHSKLRDIVKTIPVKPANGKELLYNELNKGTELPNDVDVVLPQDSNKGRDAIQKNLSIASETLARTEEGQQMIKSLNEVLGHKSSTQLVFDPRLAYIGFYDQLYKKFNNDYSKPIWIKENSRYEYAEMIVKLYRTWAEGFQELLENGQSTKGLPFWRKMEDEEFPEALKGLCAEGFCNGDPYKHETTCVVVYKRQQPDEVGSTHVVCQRALAYAGNPEEDVILPAKQEVASPGQMLSLSPVMDVVARVMHSGLCPDQENGFAAHPEAAKELMEGFEKRTIKHSALRAMYHKKSLMKNGEILPKVPFFIQDQGQEYVNPDLVDKVRNHSPYLIAKARQNTLRMKELAKCFSNVIIGFGYFDCYLPALFQQEGNPSSSVTLGGHVLEVLKASLVSDDAASLAHAKLSRAQKAFANLIKSEDATKMRGRLGVYAKVSAHPAVKINHLVVAYSENKDSYYQTLKAQFTKNGQSEESIEGAHGIMQRMPMPFPIGVSVKIVYPGDPMYDLVPSIYVALVNPLVAYVEAGDFDGDDRLFVPLFNNTVQQVSVGLIETILKERTGMDPYSLAASGDYIGDHYGFKKSEFKSSLLEGKELVSKSDLVSVLSGATEVQQSIGIFHSVALHGEIANHLVMDLSEIFNESPGVNLGKRNTSLVLMEVYEKPLGGYEYSLWKLLRQLDYIRKQHKTDNAGKVRESLKECGLNSEEAYMVVQAALFTGYCRGGTKDAYKGFKSVITKDKSVYSFVRATTELLFTISKGQFKPYIKDNAPKLSEDYCSPFLNMAIYFLEWLYNLDSDKRCEVENILAVNNLKSYLENSLISLTEGSEEFKLELAERLGIGKQVYDHNIGREKYTFAPEVDQLDVDVEDKEEGMPLKERVFPTMSECDISPEVNNLIIDLGNYIPKSRFGSKDGFKGFLRTNIAKKLECCSEDQLAAVKRFFFGFYDKQTKTLNPLHLLTGAAGTGKSFVVDIINDILENCTNSVPVKLGSTGVASENIGGKGTFGSMFGQGIGEVVSKDFHNGTPNAAALSKSLIKNVGVSPNENKFYVFIIDEISMIPAHQLQVAIEQARIAYNSYVGTQQEFYNFCFLLVGDPLQLAPVGGEQFFKFPSFDGVSYDPVVEHNTIMSGLYTVHRQEDEKDFAVALDEIAKGHEAPESLKGCLNRDIQPTFSVYCTNSEASYVNKEAKAKLKSDGSKSVVFNSQVRVGSTWFTVLDYDPKAKTAKLKDKEGNTLSGSKAYKLLEFLPNWVQPVIEIVEGMQYMFRQNNYPSWVNGTLGTVTSVNEDGFQVEVNGEIYTVSKEYSVNVPKDHSRAYYGILGHAAHALTVAKTQGLTFDKPIEVCLNPRILDIEGFNINGLVYVALSRVTKPDNLRITLSGFSSNTLDEMALDQMIHADEEAVDLRDLAISELKSYVDQQQITPAEDENNFHIKEIGEDYIEIGVIDGPSLYFYPGDAEDTDKFVDKSSDKVKNFEDLKDATKAKINELIDCTRYERETVNSLPISDMGVDKIAGHIEEQEDGNIHVVSSDGKELYVSVGKANKATLDIKIPRLVIFNNDDKAYKVKSSLKQKANVAGKTIGSYELELNGQQVHIFKNREDMTKFIKAANNNDPFALDSLVELGIQHFFITHEDEHEAITEAEVADMTQDQDKTSNHDTQEEQEDSSNELADIFDTLNNMDTEDNKEKDNSGESVKDEENDDIGEIGSILEQKAKEAEELEDNSNYKDEKDEKDEKEKAKNESLSSIWDTLKGN